MPAMLNSVPITLSRIPISVLLISSAGWGSEAVYWTLSATCVLRGVVAVVWFRSERWRRKYLWNHATSGSPSATSGPYVSV